MELLDRALELKKKFAEKHGSQNSLDVVAVARLLVEVELRNESLPNSYMDPATGKWMKRR